jgi:hypothetical protein
MVKLLDVMRHFGLILSSHVFELPCWRQANSMKIKVMIVCAQVGKIFAKNAPKWHFSSRFSSHRIYVCFIFPLPHSLLIQGKTIEPSQDFFFSSDGMIRTFKTRESDYLFMEVS